jgi:hypothetical protein
MTFAQHEPCGVRCVRVAYLAAVLWVCAALWVTRAALYVVGETGPYAPPLNYWFFWDVYYGVKDTYHSLLFVLAAAGAFLFAGTRLADVDARRHRFGDADPRRHLWVLAAVGLAALTWLWHLPEMIRE